MEDKLINIPLTKLTESKTNPRKHFPEASLKELAASIKQNGLINPVLVRPVKESIDSYELVDGARRFRAVKIANTMPGGLHIDKIPVIVRILTDEQVRIVQLVSFLQNEDVHPLDEAEGFNELLKYEEHTPKTIADKIGKSETYVRKRLKLCNLIPAAKKSLSEGILPLGHALLLSTQTKELQETTFKLVFNVYNSYSDKWSKRYEMISLKQLSEFITEKVDFDLSKVSFDITDKILYPKAGSCTDCPKNTSNDLALFEGYEKNICTDFNCRMQKTQFHISKVTAGLKIKKEIFHYIAPLYQISRWVKQTYPDVINENDFRNSKKDGCKHTVKGIVVEVNDRDAKTPLGTVKYICVNKECNTHYPKYSARGGSSSSGSNKSKTEAEKKQAREHAKYIIQRKKDMIVMSDYRTQLFNLAVKNFKKLDKEDYVLIADELEGLFIDKEFLVPMPFLKGTNTGKIIKELAIPQLQKLIFAHFVDYHPYFSMWQDYEGWKEETTEQKKPDLLMTLSTKILGKDFVSKIIKETEAKYAKQPKEKKSDSITANKSHKKSSKKKS
jgi:ParB family chromosome partitioning protein